MDLSFFTGVFLNEKYQPAIYSQKDKKMYVNVGQQTYVKAKCLV
jgi:hypothetical protein